MRETLRRYRIPLFAAALVAVAGYGALTLIKRPQAPHIATGPVQDDLSRLNRGVDSVALRDDAGQSLRWGDLKGRPRAVFFGFTHCPVICPVTVWELNNALDKIGAPAEPIAIQFITLDPARDTPEALEKYFAGFNGRVDAYAATPEATAALAGAFEVVYRRTEVDGGDYTIDHTPTVFLLDASGRVVDVIGYGAPPEVVETRLRALVSARPKAG